MAAAGLSAAEEQRRAVRLWYDCAAKAASANDLGPALQLAEMGLALCSPDGAGHAAEAALLKALQGALRRAAVRGPDPLAWSAVDVADFLRLSAGDPGLALREVADGQRLLQLAAAGPDQLARLVDGQMDPAAMERAAALLSNIAESAAATAASGYHAGSALAADGEAVYEVQIGPTTFEVSVTNTAAPGLGTLGDLKRAIVTHVGDADVLGPDDEFRLVRLDGGPGGREIAIGQDTRALERMVMMGRRPVLRVVGVRHGGARRIGADPS